MTEQTSPRLATEPRAVDVVVHTHWDREWYLPRETTLARAEAVLREVLMQLQDGRLPYFLFDGQTAAWRDLLAVAEPTLAEGLRQQARAGRLGLGPWFVMADEFLVSGESLLRNLEFGLADARAASRSALDGATAHLPQPIGYLPDSFGHVAQMPLILSEFGLPAAMVWRGADAPAALFDWQSPSGASLPTVYLSEGYYQHPLNLPAYAAALTSLLAKLAQFAGAASAEPLLLTQGGDHLLPAPELAARLAAFNAAQNIYRLRFATLATHTEALLAAHPPGSRPVLEGELRHNQRAFVLPDVLSSRRHLKLAHQRAEDRLVGHLEPLVARFWPAGTAARMDASMGAPNAAPMAALERCWRLLIEQQAHDSICGCSTDAVHEEMAHRFVQLEQQLDALERQVLAACGAVSWLQHGPGGTASAPSVWADDSQCMFWNPLPVERSGWWPVQAFLTSASSNLAAAPQSVQVLGPQGQALPAVLVRAEQAFELVSPLDDFPERLNGHRLHLWVHSRVPPATAWPLRLQASSAPAAVPREPIQALANAAWHLGLFNPQSGQAEADEGLLLATDRLQGAVPRSISLLSELDAGDSYSFCPAPRPMSTQQARWRRVAGWREGPVQRLVLATEMRLPAGLDAQRQSGSPDQVIVPVQLILTLNGDEPAVHAELSLNNTAQDHRLRLMFDLGPELPASSGADSALAWIERPARLAQVPSEITRDEMPVVVNPSLSALTAGPWALAHEALNEFELMRHGSGHALGLTLLRCVGWLSRRDLRTRGLGAGPDLPTPGAQCPGEHLCRFMLAAHAGQAAEADAPRRAALQAASALRRPPRLLRGHAAKLPGAFTIGNAALMMSSLRRLPDGRTELRLFNPGPRAEPYQTPAGQWQAVHADGRVIEGPLVPVPAQGVLTLRGWPAV
jgi:mannosylglycerate hydrolase